MTRLVESWFFWSGTFFAIHAIAAFSRGEYPIAVVEAGLAFGLYLWANGGSK